MSGWTSGLWWLACRGLVLKAAFCTDIVRAAIVYTILCKMLTGTTSEAMFPFSRGICSTWSCLRISFILELALRASLLNLHKLARGWRWHTTIGPSSQTLETTSWPPKGVTVWALVSPPYRAPKLTVNFWPWKAIISRFGLIARMSVWWSRHMARGIFRGTPSWRDTPLSVKSVLTIWPWSFLLLLPVWPPSFLKGQLRSPICRDKGKNLASEFCFVSFSPYSAALICQ